MQSTRPRTPGPEHGDPGFPSGDTEQPAATEARYAPAAPTCRQVLLRRRQIRTLSSGTAGWSARSQPWAGPASSTVSFSHDLVVVMLASHAGKRASCAGDRDACLLPNSGVAGSMVRSLTAQGCWTTQSERRPGRSVSLGGWADLPGSIGQLEVRVVLRAVRTCR